MDEMPFRFDIDERIQSSCCELGDWPLSRVFLKNNADYPWLILVPRIEHAQAIDDLSSSQRVQLIEEISALSAIMRKFFKLDKLNVGALGNIVSQLHVHVIARSDQDPLWPHGVWQAALSPSDYAEARLEDMVIQLQDRMAEPFLSPNS